MKAIIQSPTPSIELSKQFYEKLAFSIIDINKGFFAVSKDLIIEVNEDRFARAGLKLISDNWNEFLAKNNLMSATSKTANGYLLTSPEGCCIYLEETTKTSLNLTNGANKPVLGNFAGLSLETNQIKLSLLFWEQFGFKQVAGNLDQGWLSLSNKAGFSISLMIFGCCPHLFFNPSLSFFNGANNPDIIAEIRSLNIPITEEITQFNKDNIVDNIIIRDPGGLGYFIFND